MTATLTIHCDALRRVGHRQQDPALASRDRPAPRPTPRNRPLPAMRRAVRWVARQDRQRRRATGRHHAAARVARATSTIGHPGRPQPHRRSLTTMTTMTAPCSRTSIPTTGLEHKTFSVRIKAMDVTRARSPCTHANMEIWTVKTKWSSGEPSGISLNSSGTGSSLWAIRGHPFPSLPWTVPRSTSTAC